MTPPLTDDERMALDELMDRLHRPLSHKEIAKRTGLAHGTVHNIEARALKKLEKLARGWAP